MKRKLFISIILILSVLSIFFFVFNDDKNESSQLAFYIDGRKVTILKSNENYFLENYKCSNDEKVVWDNTNKKVIVKHLTKGTQCKIYFSKVENNYIGFIGNDGTNNYLFDHSSNNNNGKIYGKYEMIDDGKFLSLYFDGRSKYKTLSKVTGNYDFGSEISLVSRFKIKKLDAQSFVLANTENGGGAINITDQYICGWYFLTDTKGSYNNGDYYSICSSSIATLDTWYTTVFTFDGTNFKLCINNSCQSKTVSTTTKYIGLSPYMMAVAGEPLSNTSYTRNFSGTVSDAFVFNRVLSDTEISNYYSEKISLENVSDYLDGYKSNELDNFVQDENDYFSYENANYDFGNTITYGIRFKKVNSASSFRLISNTQLSGCGMGKVVGGYNFGCYITEEGKYVTAYSTSDFVSGQWTTVVGTYDGSSLKIYVNGILENTVSVSGNIGVADVNTLFFAESELASSPANFMEGYFNEAIILDRAMSADEIKEWNDNEVLSNTSELLMHYKVGEKIVNGNLSYTINNANGDYKSMSCLNNSSFDVTNNTFSFSNIKKSDFCEIVLE